MNRRNFLFGAGAGFGGLALSALLADLAPSTLRADRKPAVTFDPADPLAERKPHRAGKVKHVIFLFMNGGPSQVDTFDYKPELIRLHGKPVPEGLKSQPDKVGGVFKHCKDELLAGPWKWKQHGEGGLWMSELLPHTARHADDLCVLRSMYCDSSNHAPACFQMNTGAILGGKPSLGSWITYGLGSPNRNLPGFVLLFKVAGLGGSANWSNAFLPAAFQGTQFRHEGPPVLDLTPPAETAEGQRSTLDALQALNRKHAAARPGVPDLEGRIASYELAYRMQSEAIDVGDIDRESKATRELYGVDDANGETALFGRMCLLSRRLVEKGVRFVQIYSGMDKNGWDAHDHSNDYMKRNCAQTDRPVAALLTDLKRRGLLDSTLVIWAGEFGRTPMMQGDGGRNHNPYGFSMWLAGGGVKGGQAIGETDAIGLRAEKEPHPIRDVHATILTAMGLDPEELYFEHNGRPERLTGVAGSAKVIPGVLG